MQQIQGKSSHEETSEIGNKYFVGYCTRWQKDCNYAVTNIDVKILIYLQMFILVKADFFLEGVQQSSLIIKDGTNKARHIEETKQKSGNYCK